MMGRDLRSQARLMLDDWRVYRMGGKDVKLREVASPEKKDEVSSVCAAEAPTVPIYYVSWQDAVEFCRQLTTQERSAKRLPKGAIAGLLRLLPSA